MSSIAALESLKSLLAFVASVEAGGFAAAGRRLGLSASAVGKAVGRLEARLGVKLLQRTTRSIALTGEGELLYERSARILDDVRAAESAIASTRMTPQGRLKASLPAAIGHRIIIPALGDFAAQYPDIRLDLRLDDRRVDIVEEGYDIVLRAGYLEDSRLVARRLGPHQFVVCGSPHYFERHGVPQKPADLARHQCIRFRYPTTGRLEEWAFAGRPTPKMSVAAPVFGDSEAVAIAAIAGLGVAQLPEYVTSDAVASGTLQVVLAEYAINRGDLWLVWPPARSSSPQVRVFADFITKLITSR